MDERPDMELLREYAKHGSERAFETVVSRHLDLVYHSALRQTGQPEQAKDVSQTVFTLLARKRMAQVMKARDQLKVNDAWANARTTDERIDDTACFLYGALDLNEQQYAQVQVILRNRVRGGGMKLPKLDQLMAGAFKKSGVDAEAMQGILDVLNPEQRKSFQSFTK